ncbi:MAG: hypothetical protein K0U24_01360 [Gammaproteobacteria bacterium]|nr:hypothetical protein [Gammaproteobacteria bacterium]MCH9762876.1 hypothetical protein [Gammaproteobacteria bacterium]
MKGKSHWVIRTLKKLLKFGFMLIEVGFAAEKPEKAKYNVHEAEELYNQDLIGLSEYVRCVHDD